MKLWHNKVFGSTIVIEVIALELFLVRISLLTFLRIKETELFANSYTSVIEYDKVFALSGIEEDVSIYLIPPVG
jgi:hypothetical protein